MNPMIVKEHRIGASHSRGPAPASPGPLATAMEVLSPGAVGPSQPQPNPNNLKVLRPPRVPPECH